MSGIDNSTYSEWCSGTVETDNNATYSQIAADTGAVSDATYSNTPGVVLADASYSKLSVVTINNATKYEEPVTRSEASNKKASNRKAFIVAVVLIAIVVYLVLTTIAIIAVGVKTSQPMDASPAQQMTDSAQTFLLNSLLKRLETLENTTSQEILVNLLVQQVKDQVFETFEGNFPVLPAPSCAALPPSSPSGYYWVRASNGSAVRVYCDMTRTCGNVTGGWMRVADLDMTDSSQQCPSGLRQHSDFDLRTCGIDSDSGACSSVLLGTSTVQYSQVCGRVIAYQFRSTDAFHLPINDDIDSNYVDGVSLTHGPPVRQHIWTFIAALTQSNLESSCPCIHTDEATMPTGIPSFVGDDYFCDSGNNGAASIFDEHVDNPLWNGDGCGAGSMCCSFNSPPWFYKQLPQPTTDDIEMRVCCDQGRNDEDIRIEQIEIYVQ